MITIKAKEGLEDLYNLAKQSLACVEQDAEQEYEAAVREIQERIDAKYADKRATLNAVVDSLSEAYEEDDPVEAEPAEQPDEASAESEAPQLADEIKQIPEDLMSL